MGNTNSQLSTLSDEERKRLDEKLERMENNVRITYKSHFVSSEYYRKLAQGLDILTTIVLPTSAAGLAVSVNTSKRIGVGLSVIGLVFGGFQKFDTSSNYHPAKFEAKHFDAGIGLQSFHNEVMVYRQLRMKDKSLTAKEFMNECRELIQKKEHWDKIIQSDTWAYIRAKNRDDHFKSKWKKKNACEIVENQRENDKENEKRKNIL